MLGYSEEELSQLTHADVTHPEDAQRYASIWQQLQTGDLPFFLHEKRYRHKDGYYFWVQITISILRDRQGELLSDVAVVVNIDDRKQAEAALTRKTEELDQFFSVSIDLLCIADTRAIFVV
jgi:PAS domain S-box-containing protein